MPSPHDHGRTNSSRRGVDDPSRGRSGAESDAFLAFLVSLMTLTAFLALFVFRAFDDNWLTSWQWAFAGVDVGTVFLILLTAVSLAYPVSRLSLPVRSHAALLFVASFVIAAIFWRVPEVNVDAAKYFAQAKHLELHGVGSFLRQWGREITAWTVLPLVPFLHGLIFSVVGETRAAIQVFTTLLFSGTVVLTYLIGKALWDEKVGGYGAALLAAMPYLLTQVPLMLVDVPSMFFLTLAVFATIGAVRRGGAGRLALASLAIALAALAKYSTWLMLSVLPVIVLCHLGHGRTAVLRRAGLLALGAALLAGAVVFMKFDVVAEQLRMLQSYQLPGLRRWGESHASTFLFQTHPFIAAAALYSVLVAVRKRDLRYVIVGWMLLLLVVVLEVERSRYVLVAFPMLALMAGYGLAGMRNARISKHVVSCTVASMLVTAIFVYLPFLQGTSAVNIQRAGAYLDSIDTEMIEVVTLPQPRSRVNPSVAVPILDIFTRQRIAYHHDMTLAPRRQATETSPVRFTWEIDLSTYPAAGTGPPPGAVVVITGEQNPTLPEALARRIADYRLAREFGETDRVFRYKTMVRVYRPL